MTHVCVCFTNKTEEALSSFLDIATSDAILHDATLWKEHINQLIIMKQEMIIFQNYAT